MPQHSMTSKILLGHRVLILWFAQKSLLPLPNSPLAGSIINHSTATSKVQSTSPLFKNIKKEFIHHSCGLT